MSVFALPQNPSPFGANGVTGIQYDKIESSSVITESNFKGNNMRFRIDSSGGTRWFLPSKSYFRIRYGLTKPDGDKLDKSVSPAMGTAGNLFQSCTVRVGSTVVSRIDDNMAQIDALATRMYKSKAQIESVGRGGNNWSIATAEMVTEAKATKNRELIWQPPNSFFNSFSHALPGGTYDITLTGDSNYDTFAVQGLAGAVDATTYKFIIKEVSLYACFVEGPRGDDQKYVLDLSEIKCQTAPTSDTSSNQLVQLSVAPTTDLLAVAFQAKTQTNKVEAHPSYFRAANDELKLKRMYISYNGLHLPQVDADPDFTADDSDLFTKLYLDTQLNTGMYFNPGGAETETEWKGRGPYYCYQVPLDGSAHGTQVSVNFTLKSDATNLLLFSRSRVGYLIRTRDSRVVQIESSDRAPM